MTKETGPETMVSIKKSDTQASRLSLDQILVFVTVADTGSFSQAALSLGRVQSAVSATIQKMEEHLGVALFDRSGYRPILSDQGRTLLSRARRIVSETGLLQAQARAFASGAEPELSITIDGMFPMHSFLQTLNRFEQEWPFVSLKISVENMGSAAESILDRRSQIGLLSSVASDMPGLIRYEVAQVALEMVAAPTHPFYAWAGQDIPTEITQDYVQLVLSDRSSLFGSREFGVFSTRTWRVGDLGAKHAMLVAGLGWGSMPEHMVRDDIHARRLVRVKPFGWGKGRSVAMFVAYRSDTALGPAAQWLANTLVNETDSSL